jgi:hypothetical protein
MNGHPLPMNSRPRPANRTRGKKIAATALAGFSVLAFAGCASQGEVLGPTTTASIVPPPSQTVSRLPSGTGYQLSGNELELDCRKLTGRMAVRIVQVRDFQTRRQTTALSRGVQSATKPIFGGSSEGIDPDGRYARDRGMLEAYNQRLAEKNCPNFDLETELSPDAKEPPRTRPLPKT